MFKQLIYLMSSDKTILLAHIGVEILIICGIIYYIHYTSKKYAQELQQVKAENASLLKRLTDVEQMLAFVLKQQDALKRELQQVMSQPIPAPAPTPLAAPVQPSPQIPIQSSIPQNPEPVVLPAPSPIPPQCGPEKCSIVEITDPEKDDENFSDSEIENEINNLN
jgi:hypothetical protein